jgi:gluconate 2-dehydrogenase gamma chain
MADSAQPKDSSRRSFLKIGAGVVAGAVIATAVEVPYYSSVLGGKNGSSSTLQSELSSTQEQLTSTQQALTSASSQITSLQNQVSSATAQASSASAQSSSLQAQLDQGQGFLTLSSAEQAFLSAAALALIPDDGNGPSAADAGVVYFIDRQLATDYGKSAHMYMEGPFIMPNLTTSVTVNDREGNPITYAGGTTMVTQESGMQYQYHNNFREFFRYGIDAFENYCNSAYGKLFENLSSAQQVQALTDLYNNKPMTTTTTSTSTSSSSSSSSSTSKATISSATIPIASPNFNNILPSDFFYELFVMVWSGYFMDPLYGGNLGMQAWTFSAFNGVNMGDFYNEGYTGKQLMLMTTPIALRPASLAQYQKGSP